MNGLADHYLREGPGIPKDAPKRRGVRLFGEIIAREWWELIKLNLVFILFALPLVTLPAAAVATTRICVAMVEDRNHYLLRDFWETFRSRFLAATLAGWLIAALALLSAYVATIYARAAALHLIFVAPLAVAGAVAACAVLYGMHLAVLLAMSRLPVHRLLRPVAMGLIARPLPALAAVAFAAALWFVHIVLYPLSAFMPALFIFSFGTLAVTLGVHKAAVLGLSLVHSAEPTVLQIGDAGSTPIRKEREMSGEWLRAALAAATAGLALMHAGGNSQALAQEPVKLKWALWDLNSVAYYKPLIDAYKAKNPNVTVEPVDFVSGDYQTVVQVQLTGGSSDLDLISIKDVPSYANLVRARLLLDMTQHFEAQKIDAAPYAGLIDELKVGGKLYALPFSSNFWITYYNKDLFDAAGVKYPGNDLTLAQFDELARKLTSGFGANKVSGALFHTWRSTVQLPCTLDGHTVVEGTYEFLKPCYERVLKLQDEKVVPSYASLKTSSTHYSAPFYNNQVALLPMGSWFIGTQIAKVKSGESKSKNWGIVRFPHPEGVAAGTTNAQLTGIAVAANSTKKNAALDFATFIAGPEAAVVIANTGSIPAYRTGNVLDTIASLEGFPQDKNSRAALETVKAYLEMPVDPRAADIEVVLNRAHDAIMTNNKSIDAGIAEMNAGVRALK